jgi:hypothetical protein
VPTLGAEVVVSFKVTEKARSANFVPNNDWSSSEPPVVESSPVDETILTSLAGYPFSAVRALSRRTCLHRSRMQRHLTQSLRFTIRYLRWILHFMTDEQKQMRVDTFGERLRVLSVQSTPVAWYCHSERVLGRLAKWSWSDMDGTWRNCPWHRAADNSVAKSHAESCVESRRILHSETPLKGEQIQCTMLYK